MTDSFELLQQYQSICRLGRKKDTMVVTYLASGETNIILGDNQFGKVTMDLDVGLGKTSTVLKGANFLRLEQKMLHQFHRDEASRMTRLRKLGVRKITKLDDSVNIEFSCLRIPRKLKKRLKKLGVNYVEETKRLAATIDLACHISLMDCGMVTGRKLVIGEDLNTAKAASITGMKYSEITPDVRRLAKARVFYDMYSRQVHEVKPRTLKSLASEPRWARFRDYVNKDLRRQKMMNRTFEILYGDSVVSQHATQGNGWVTP